MAKKDLQQLQTIKERMIAAGIPEDEVNALVDPLKNEFKRRVCGLIWEHTTTSIPDMEGKIPALIPVTGKNIVNDINGDNHILIEGENLLALMAMQYTHIDENNKGMIDVIYIDPPYNTGSVSFAYNDKFEKSEWLSMMDIRLKLAKNLLKDDGVIFISIDDSYQAELKMLCDDIFGNNNFLSQIVVKTANGVFGTRASQCKNTIVKVKDYVIAYVKNKQYKELDLCPLYMPTSERFDPHYSIVMPSPGSLVKMSLLQWISMNTGMLIKFTQYRIPLKMDNISKMMELDNEFNEFIINHADIIYQDVDFSLSIPERVKLQLTTGFPIRYKDYILHKTRGGKIRQYISLKEGLKLTDDYHPERRRAVAMGDLWEGFDIDMKNVSNEGMVKFKNGKKPERLIRQLIKLVNNPNAIVLDFFAGSGTTGHAVLELNKEDGGNRQFILCTNNELGKEAKKAAKKNGYEEGSEEYESLGVCHAVTYPRMQNIFPNYPGNNLYYYRINQDIAESTIDDVTIANMASRAVFYVAMKENVYNAERHDDYYLLYNDETDIAVVIDPDMDMFDVEDEIVPTAFSRQYRKVYCSVYEPCMRNGIEYIPYPKEVMDVLKAAKNDIRREVE